MSVRGILLVFCAIAPGRICATQSEPGQTLPISKEPSSTDGETVASTEAPTSAAGYLTRTTALAAASENEVEFDPATAYTVFEGDILISKLPHGMQGGAVTSRLVRYRRNASTRLYEVPYDALTMLSAPPDTLESLRWAMEYISRGSNIMFRPREATDQMYITFIYDQPGCGAVPPFADQPLPMHLDRNDAFCSLRGSVLHELMHSLGFMHEHQRPDRDMFLDPSYLPTGFRHGRDIVANLVKARRVRYSTPFDYYSIMHYPGGSQQDSGYSLVPTDPRIDRLNFRGNRMFLTTCDWNALNTVYPGPRRPPPCVPEPSPPDVLQPLSKNNISDENECRYSPSQAFGEHRCVFPNGTEFPDLSFIPTDADFVVPPDDSDGRAEAAALEKFCTSRFSSDPCQQICGLCGLFLGLPQVDSDLLQCVKDMAPACNHASGLPSAHVIFFVTILSLLPLLNH